MKEEEIILNVEHYIKEKMYNESSGHDWWHIKRVYDLALKINEKENADNFTIKMIALLHDIYDDKFSDGNMREKLIELMKKINIFEEINKDRIENILFSTENLGFKGGFNNIKISKEGQIVQDADRIDAIGAIGIARCFAYNGKKGNPIYNPEVGIIEISSEEEYRKTKRHAINHFYEKLLKIKDTMNTTEGRNIALERTKYMENFLEEFYKEWEGKK